MKIVCENCAGSGRIRDENGHSDICNICFGLGFVDVPDYTGSPVNKRRATRFYVFLSISAVVLGLYYVALYIALLRFGFSFLVTMVLFVGGHIAIFGGFMFYVLLKILKNNRESNTGH